MRFLPPPPRSRLQCLRRQDGQYTIDPAVVPPDALSVAIDFFYSDALPSGLALSELAVLLQAAAALSANALREACRVRLLGTLGCGDLAGVLDVYEAAWRSQDRENTNAVRQTPAERAFNYIRFSSQSFVLLLMINQCSSSLSLILIPPPL